VNDELERILKKAMVV